MRTTMWVPLVLVLVPGVVMAQGRMGTGRMQGRGVQPRMMQGQGLMQGPGAMQEGGPAQRLLDRKDELGLTDQQVSRLEALAQDWTAAHAPMRAEMEQMRAARQQMTDEQRAKMQAFREQARATGENARKEIESLLTEEQLQTLQSRRGRMMGGRGGAGLGVGQRMQGIRGRGGMGLGPGAGVMAPRGRMQGVGPGAVVAPRAGAGIGPQGLGRPVLRGRVLGPVGPAQRLQVQRRLAVPPAAGMQMRRRMLIQRDTLL